MSSKWTKDSDGWHHASAMKLKGKVYPLNNIFEWEVELEGEILDAGSCASVDEGKLIIESFFGSQTD